MRRLTVGIVAGAMLLGTAAPSLAQSAAAGRAAAAAAPGGAAGVAGPVVGRPADMSVPPHRTKTHKMTMKKHSMKKM